MSESSLDERQLLQLALRDAARDLRHFVEAQRLLAADGAPRTPDDWQVVAAPPPPQRTEPRTQFPRRLPPEEPMAPVPPMSALAAPTSAATASAAPPAPAAAAAPTDTAPRTPPAGRLAAAVASAQATAPPPAKPQGSTLGTFKALAKQGKPPAEAQMGERPSSMDAVRKELGDCQRCKLHQRRTNIVFGVGEPNARLMFIGEGPGADEDRLGEPFVGKAGQLLTRIIEAMGLSREQVYIANIVKCRPPENRDPEPDEVAACEPFLAKQVAFVAPEVIVTVGRVASHALLNLRTPITRLRGTWQKYRGILVMPTLHPAYLLRTPEAKRLVWNDIQEVMRALKLERPS